MNFKIWFNENKSNPNWFRLLKVQDPAMFKIIDEWISGAPAEKAFLFLQGKKTKPTCVCGGALRWYPGRGYMSRCSVKCSAIATALIRSNTLKSKSSEQKELTAAKALKTNIAKGGIDYASIRANKRSIETLKIIEAARVAAMIAKYGVSNPSSLEHVQVKRRETFAARTKEQRAATAAKRMMTRIANGLSVPNDHPSVMGTKKQYTRRVRYLTDISVAGLEAFGGRSMIYHVDHKFSVLHGFKQQVNPAVIAHKANLRLVTRSENCKKNSKSSISLSDLLSLINDDVK